MQPQLFLLSNMPRSHSKLIAIYVWCSTGGSAPRKVNAVWAIRGERFLQNMLRDGQCGYHETWANGKKVTLRVWFATPDNKYRLGNVKFLD